MIKFSKQTTGNTTEPIAIIGIGCRFPHGVNSPESFWEMLCAGTDVITEIPPDRWNLNTFYDPDPSTPGTMQHRHGGFLEHIDLFDAQFFGFSPREANSLDPQQRLLLELVWEALENGGQTPEKLAGTRTGVFIGGFAMDYKLLGLSEMQRNQIGIHTSTGGSATMLSNRISHWFDFRGPSMSIDTACSSSLIASYLACQSIWTGGSDFAVAGGANTIFKPEWTIATSKGGFLSPDGRCKAFDERANGYVRGEGAGIVVLKPLSQAMADEDRIYAVILGGALNQDGHTQGITVPNEESQIALMREAYKQAGIVPGQVQYIEAHGTGTPVGDPIEANAIGKVLSTDRPAGEQCIMGTVKTNIGHLEAAAGVAALIKAALCLYYSKIPPNLHFETPNPKIPFEDLHLRIPTALEPFPNSEKGRFAGVNSFGFGGANAHLVLQNADNFSAIHLSHDNLHTPSSSQEENQTTVSPQDTLILPLSARSEEALKEVVRSYQNLSWQDLKYYDLCYHAALRKGHHSHRLALMASTKEELVERMNVFLNGEKQFGVFAGQSGEHNTKIAFVFSGMGPQWWAMGRQLLQENALFQEIIKRCDHKLGQYTTWSLWDELTAEEEISRINETQIAQPAIFAIQIALAALWDSWGICPDAIVGHSVGEVAAAYVAGALNLEDAIRIVFNRSRLQHKTEGQGKMLAVGLPQKEVEGFLKGYEESVSIAAINSPNAVTLAGETDVLEKLEKMLEQKEVFCRFLKVNVPYHSPKMEPLKQELIEALQDINPQATTYPLFSTVSGQMINGQDLTPHYWADNMRNPVLFASAIEELVQAGCYLFLELSAHPVLATSIAECLAVTNHQGMILPSLKRKEPEQLMMLGSFAKLYTVGYPIDWNRLYTKKGRFVQLPTYPWQREYYWIEESEESREYRLGSASRRTVMGQIVHPLLGSRFESAYPVWEVEIGHQRHLRYLDDHQIQGNVVYPGAGYVEMALVAAVEVFKQTPCVLENIEFKKALFLDENELLTLQFIFDPHLNIFEIFRKHDKQTWTLHATGKMVPVENHSKPSAMVRLDEIPNICPQTIAAKDCYLQLRQLGLEYGHNFQAIKEIQCGHNAAFGKIELAEELTTEDYQLHPSILDACFQIFTAIVAFSEEEPSVYLPVRIEQLRIFSKIGRTVWGYAGMVEQTTNDLKGNIQLFDEAGEVLAELKGFHCHALETAKDRLIREIQQALYEYQWQLKPRERITEKSAEKTDGTWLIFADNAGIGQQIAEQLREREASPTIITPGHAYAATKTGYFQIRPDSQNDMLSLIKAISTHPLHGVLHLWSLDINSPEKQNFIEASNKLGCLSVLHLVKALAEENHAPHLWLVTRGSQIIDQEKSVSLAQTPLWGMGRVIINEHPEFHTTMIDLGNSQENNIQSLFTELWANDKEDEVAFRNSSRYVHRLVRRSINDFQPLTHQTVSSTQEMTFSAEGTTLVTGGLSGFGLATAKWLIDRGVQHLMLMGRSGAASAQAREALDAMKKKGIDVKVAQADVSEPVQVANMLSEIRQTMPPLKGIIHAANVYDDAVLLKMDQTRFNKVMAPKAIGAWNLHSQTLNDQLDFFVLFSSVAAVIGNQGQGNYVAANSFLDALAFYRRQALNLPALTINWGAVADVGYLARNTDIKEYMDKIGAETLSSKMALTALEELLPLNAVNVTVARMDWFKWAKHNELGLSPRFSQLITTEAGSAQVDGRVECVEKIKAVPLHERRAILESQIMALVAQVLGISQSKQIPLSKGFSDMGMDSMLSVELRNRLQTTFACTLPATLTFKYPNISAIVNYFTEDVLSGLFSSPKTEVTQQETDKEAQLSEDLDKLSHDEIAEQLAREVAALKQQR